MKRIAGILTLIISSLTVCASYLVDNSETATTVNTSGGAWVTFSDGYSYVEFIPGFNPGQSGNYCRKIDWVYNAGAASQYAGAVTSLNGTWSGVDLSGYKGIRFFARGYGLYEITLGTAQTSAENNHYSKKIFLSEEWKLYELPFSEFTQSWGTPKPWDPSTVFSVGFNVISAIGNSGSIYLDNIEFYLQEEAHSTPDPNIIIQKPKVNQVGYLPDESKYFCITADSVPVGEPYYILNENKEIVYSNFISGSAVNDNASTGEMVWKVNFTSFSQPGHYTIKVRDKESYPFQISDSVYNELMLNALRCFYLIRCGLAENDPVTGIDRPACHTVPAFIRGGTGTVDATGGWHNACDMGLFVHETAISISYMLWLWELKNEELKSIRNNIPESGNSVSDLLDEAKWGLTWLLKMQRSDGSVYHKADGEPDLFDCIAPDQDPVGRKVSMQKEGEVQTPSTIDAADFTAVMSQAARVFTDIDAEFAQLCLEAASKSWAWVNVNQDIGQTDPYYPDHESWQEFFWAKAEMSGTLNDNSMRNQLSSVMDTATLTNIGWGSPHMFGYMSLYFNPNTSEALKNKIKSKVQSAANTIASVSSATGYGVALQWFEYWWESNENVLSKGVLLLFAHEITGSLSYRNAALAQLNYILGLNSLNKCFVMSHGSDAMQHPWHWIYLVYGKEIPGWMAGGPNSYFDGADFFLQDLITKGTPKAKCYADMAECDLGSWASNEGETSENAALVFLSGYFYKGKQSDPVLSDRDINGSLSITVYPNPCTIEKSCNQIVFSGIPDNATINIYNLNGSMVSRLGEIHNGEITWDFHGNKEHYNGNFIFTVLISNQTIYKGIFSVIK